MAYSFKTSKGTWFLHGKKQGTGYLMWFSRTVGSKSMPSLPEGYIVKVNHKTGMPFCKRRG